METAALKVSDADLYSAGAASAGAALVVRLLGRSAVVSLPMTPWIDPTIH